MSTRTHIVSITKLDPIRDSVASNNDALVEAVMARYVDGLREEYDGEEPDEDELEEFREYVESMIKCPETPEEEPGCWNYVVELLAAHFNLELEDDYPFNEGWKHYQVWEPYRKMLAGHITADCDASLQHMQDGRPLKGSRIDHDGCVFGWLAPEEVAELHESLSQLDDALITDEDLADFHETFVESLQAIRDRNAVLFMAAH